MQVQFGLLNEVKWGQRASRGHTVYQTRGTLQPINVTGWALKYSERMLQLLATREIVVLSGDFFCMIETRLADTSIDANIREVCVCVCVCNFFVYDYMCSCIYHFIYFRFIEC